MADATTLSERGTPTARPARRRFGWAWLGLLPFFLFSIAFMFLPVAYLVIGSFLDGHGAVTAQNYADLWSGRPLVDAAAALGFEPEPRPRP